MRVRRHLLFNTARDSQLNDSQLCYDDTFNSEVENSIH
jgi:hypothetical protein